MNFFYSLIYSILLTFIFPFEYFKRPKSIRKIWIREKFGLIDKPSIDNTKKILWIHAVSVGEILAIYPLVRRLSTNYDVILTTITDTGRAVAKQRYKNMVREIYYLPFDLSPFLKRFIRSVTPSALLIAETEIWPNLINVTSREMPVILINGRLSERSFRRYLRARWFFRRLIERFSLILVQEEKYRDYFLRLGASEEKVVVTGNLKFDLIPEEREFPELEILPRPILIAGSTHEPEETLIAETFLRLNLPGTLIIAPRHPERFDGVEAKLKAMVNSGVTFLRYSDLINSPGNRGISLEKVILLFDKMGLLGSLYRIADIAIIGGSFIPHGGQNPLEAIYWKKPVITGPYMNNFPFVEEFWREGAVLKVCAEELAFTLEKLLRDRDLMKSLSERSYSLYQRKRGATEKTLHYLSKLIPS